MAYRDFSCFSNQSRKFDRYATKTILHLLISQLKTKIFLFCRTVSMIRFQTAITAYVFLFVMNRKRISYNVPWRWSIWRYNGKNCLCVLSYRWPSVCYLHYWVGMVWIPLKHWTSRPYLPRDGYFRLRGPYCIFWWELHHISFWFLENQTRRHCRFTAFNLFLTFSGPFSFSNLRCIYWHLYGLWFFGFWYLCAVFCFIAFPSHPGISCCHICCGSPLPDTWIYILLFSIKFFLLLSDIMCLFAMEQKKRGDKKIKEINWYQCCER